MDVLVKATVIGIMPLVGLAAKLALGAASSPIQSSSYEAE